GNKYATTHKAPQKGLFALKGKDLSQKQVSASFIFPLFVIYCVQMQPHCTSCQLHNTSGLASLYYQTCIRYCFF
ncbi:MAG TPA: hypothetical protein PKE17_05200, partial [Saprospiraceae bacterium]|nr:hypothetical protein [Saprospiraceae bacterium]